MRVKPRGQDVIGGFPTIGTDVYLADGVPGPGEVGVSLGRVTLLQHECQSRQLLDTFRGPSRGARGTFAPNAVVINSHYADANLNPGLQAAIWWDGPGRAAPSVGGLPFLRGALYLVHDNFGLHPPSARPLNWVVVHRDVAAVFDLGRQVAAGANDSPWTSDDFMAVTDGSTDSVPQPFQRSRPPTWLVRPPVVTT